MSFYCFAKRALNAFESIRSRMWMRSVMFCLCAQILGGILASYREPVYAGWFSAGGKLPGDPTGVVSGQAPSEDPSTDLSTSSGASISGGATPSDGLVRPTTQTLGGIPDEASDVATGSQALQPLPIVTPSIVASPQSQSLLGDGAGSNLQVKDAVTPEDSVSLALRTKALSDPNKNAPLPKNASNDAAKAVELALAGILALGAAGAGATSSTRSGTGASINSLALRSSQTGSAFTGNPPETQPSTNPSSATNSQQITSAKKGIWIAPDQRDAMLKLINSAATHPFAVDADGFLMAVDPAADSGLTTKSGQGSDTFTQLIDAVILAKGSVTLGIDASLHMEDENGSSTSRPLRIAATTGGKGTAQVVTLHPDYMDTIDAPALIAHELTHALDGVLGRKSDVPFADEDRGLAAENAVIKELGLDLTPRFGEAWLLRDSDYALSSTGEYSNPVAIKIWDLANVQGFAYPASVEAFAVIDRSISTQRTAGSAVDPQVCTRTSPIFMRYRYRMTVI